MKPVHNYFAQMQTPELINMVINEPSICDIPHTQIENRFNYSFGPLQWLAVQYFCIIHVQNDS